MDKTPCGLFAVTKTYGHNLGLSATFRQWRATSHCRFLHGYALEVKLTFYAPRLNANNWVIDFGSLKPVKNWLEATFDHKTLVAEDDPALHMFKFLAEPGDMSHPKLVDLVIVPATGCEAFAELIAENVNNLLFRGISPEALQGGADNGVYLHSVEVREHGANSAIFYPDPCKRVEMTRDCEPETGADRRVTREEIERARGEHPYATHADVQRIVDEAIRNHDIQSGNILF